MLIFLFLLSFFQQHNGPNSFRVIELKEGTTSEYISPETILKVSNYYSDINGYKGNIDVVNTVSYNSREQLKNIFDCEFTFSSVHYAEKGYVKQCIITKDNTETISFNIVFLQSSPHYLIGLDGGLWFVQKLTSDGFPNITSAYQINVIDTIYGRVLDGYPEDYTSPINKPAEFETLSEFVLKKETSTTIEIIPALFETVTEQVLIQESNQCQDLPTIYEEVTETVLLKEASTILSAIPQEVETVAEQVLAKDSYIEILTERPLIEVDSATVTFHEELAYFTKTINYEDCHPLYLDSCIRFQELIIPRKDTTLYFNSYNCQSGFSPFENLCIKQLEIPAVYETRFYEKLVTPATTEATEVPAQYETRKYIRIKNKDEIPDSCIAIQYAARTYQKLVQDALAIPTETEPEFESRTFERLVTNAFLESQDDEPSYYGMNFPIQSGFPHYKEVDMMDSSFYNTYLEEVIEDRLSELGYSEAAYYKNYIQYLCDKRLPISIIHPQILDSLGISFSLINENFIDTLSTINYHPLLSNSIQNVPNLLAISTLDYNCQERQYTIDANAHDANINTIYFIFENGQPIGKIKSYEDGDLLSIISLTDQTEHLIYDLSITDCDVKWPVTHIGQDTIWLDIRQIFENEEGRKVIELDILIQDCGLGTQYLQFIEGIGTNAGLFFDIQDGYVTSTLKCVDSNLGMLYTNTSSFDCGFSTATSDINNNKELIYPNPTPGLINLPDGYRCNKVWNKLGQVIESRVAGKTIDISSARPGIYTLRLISKKQTKDVMIVKI